MNLGKSLGRRAGAGAPPSLPTVLHSLAGKGDMRRSQLSMWAAPAGCLAGDTELVMNRAGRGFRMSMAEVCRRFNGGAPRGGSKWRSDIPTKVQRAEGGCIRLGTIKRCWESGVKQTYTIATERGRSIRATSDHPFLRPDGSYTSLGELQVGDEVCVNVGRTSRGETKNYYRHKYTRFHPHQRKISDGHRVSEHRLVAEASLNGLALPEYLRILREEPTTAARLTFIEPHMEVHHIDHNHRNNEASNLAVLTRREHRVHHAQFNVVNVLEQVGVDRITSITPFGEEMTYDIEMEDEPHNFIANEFAVHNCGKTIVMQWIATWAKVPTLFFSADTDEATMAERGVSILTGVPQQDVRNADSYDMEFFAHELGEKTQHISWDFETDHDDRSIMNAIEAFTTVYGECPHLIVFDVLFSFQAGTGDWQSLLEFCRFARSLAQLTDSHVAVLHHTTGGYTDTTNPIPRSGIAGKVDQFPSLIVTMARENDVLKCSVVKTRSGAADPKAEHPILVRLLTENCQIQEGSFV